MVTINELYEIVGASRDEPFICGMGSRKRNILTNSSLPTHKKFYYGLQLVGVRIPLLFLKGIVLYAREKTGRPHPNIAMDSSTGVVDETPLLDVIVRPSYKS